jgi:hypothetical protein
VAKIQKNLIDHGSLSCVKLFQSHKPFSSAERSIANDMALPIPFSTPSSMLIGMEKSMLKAGLTKEEDNDMILWVKWWGGGNGGGNGK